MIDEKLTFWYQLKEFAKMYGLSIITASILGAVTLGWLLHYFKTVRPARMAVEMGEETEDEMNQEGEEEGDGDDEEEEEPNMATLRMLKGKKVGVVKGVINKKVLAGLRPVNPFKNPKTERGLEGAIKDITIERRQLLADQGIEDELESLGKVELDESEHEEAELNDEEEEQSAPVTNPRRSSETESADDRDLLGHLGTLHGKLATAQLRARTRQMQNEMSAEERESEAQMKARQMESIMALMMNNKDKFGLDSEDVTEQLSLYNF